MKMRNHKSLVETKSSHLRKTTTVHQTSMKSIISNFTMYFSYSDENGDQTFQISRCIFHIQMKMRNHKSLVETKSSHLRKITTVRRDLNEVYHSKLTINFSHSDENGES